MRVLDGRAQAFAATALKLALDSLLYETVSVPFLSIYLANDGLGKRDGDALGGFHI